VHKAIEIIGAVGEQLYEGSRRENIETTINMAITIILS
jgi:hypothetical protein